MGFLSHFPPLTLPLQTEHSGYPQNLYFFPKTPGAYLTQWSSGQFWRNVQKHPKENHLGTYFWKVNSWFLTPGASECFVARPETTHVKLILHLILLGSQISPFEKCCGIKFKAQFRHKALWREKQKHRKTFLSNKHWFWIHPFLTLRLRSQLIADWSLSLGNGWALKVRWSGQDCWGGQDCWWVHPSQPWFADQIFSGSPSNSNGNLRSLVGAGNCLPG